MFIVTENPSVYIGRGGDVAVSGPGGGGGGGCRKFQI